MTRRLGGFRRRGFPALASLSLVTSLACGGAITGCGGDDNGGGGSTQEDAGEDAGDGSVATHPGTDAGKDAGKTSEAGPAEAGPTGGDAGEDSGLPSGPDAGDSGTVEVGDAGADSGSIDSSVADSGNGGAVDSGHGSDVNEPVDAGHDATTSVDSGSGDATVPVDSGVADTGSTVDAHEAGPAGPVAQFATTPIGLGNVNCGATASPTNLVVKNNGGGTLTVNASVPGSVFSVTPASLSLTAGQQGSFAVSAAVPTTATAGTAITNNLTVTSNDTTHASTNIQVSATPTGLNLGWTPTTADFGVAPENQADTPITMTLTNSGNAAATGLLFGVPTDPQFSMGTPSATTIPANGGSITVAANFTPNTLNPSLATVSVAVTGAVCNGGATSVTSLALNGQGGVGAVTGWPSATVDFGPGNCGGAPPAQQSFVLVNSGGIPVAIDSAALGTGSPTYSTDAVGKTIAANGGTVTVNVFAPAIPSTSAIPGSYAGSLTFTMNPGNVQQTVNLNEEAQGAILAFDTTPTGPGFGSFGPITTGTSVVQNFNVVNSGNAPANVTLSTSTPFSVGTSTFTLPGNNTLFPNTTTFSPTEPVPSSSSIGIQTANSDVLCAPLPQALGLAGLGVGGGFSADKQALTFETNCGTTAQPQSFVITNTGNAPMTWTIATSGPGAFDPSLYSVNITSDTLNPTETSTVIVTPVGIPSTPATTNPAAFASTLNITTDIPNDVTHQVALAETPLGDVVTLVAAPALLDFGPTTINSTAATQFLTLKNTGNTGTTGTPAAITVTSNNVDFAVLDSPLSIATAGGATNANVNFTAPATVPNSNNGEIASTLTFSTTDALCAPLPPAFNVQGQATAAGPSVQPGTIQFGLVNCGATAPPQVITISNNGNQLFNINGVGLNGVGATNTQFYSIALSGGAVPPGGSQTITVTPNAIPAEVDTVPDLSRFGGSVQITTDAVTQGGAPTDFNVILSMGAQGAIIDPSQGLINSNWTFASVGVGQQSAFSVPITNLGNADLLVQLIDRINPSVFSLNSAPTDIAAEIGGTPDHGAIVADFRPTQSNFTTVENATLGFSALNSVLCAPVPASWQQTITLTGPSH